MKTPSNEQGVALAIALLFTFIAGSVIISGTLMLRSNRNSSMIRFRRDHQAAQFARSGLTEALSWFRRQTGQPVTEFKPLRDLTANPALLDTDDPEIGLVRQFRIGKNIWGRYEVWRADEQDPDPVRLDFRRRFQVRDLSTQRGYTGPGNVWLIRSVGYVFERRDENVAWNEAPNHVLAIATSEGEMQRLSIQPPSQAALCIARGDRCTIGANGRIRGGINGAGIVHPKNTGVPDIGNLSENRVSGTPAISEAEEYADGPEAVFGVPQSDLRSMADLVITDPATFPDPIPQNAIIYVQGTGTLTFGPTKSLRGTGIVFVEGGVRIQSGNNSNFNGLLYVAGNLEIRETADFYGSVIARGTADIRGTGDYSTLWFDDTVLDTLRQQIGQYRWSSAFRSVLNRE